MSWIPGRRHSCPTWSSPQQAAAVQRVPAMTRTPAERRLEELAAAHATRVLAYLARRTTPAEDAADVLQEVLTTAWRRIHDAPDDPDHALAWLLATRLSTSLPTTERCWR